MPRSAPLGPARRALVVTREPHGRVTVTRERPPVEVDTDDDAPTGNVAVLGLFASVLFSAGVLLWAFLAWVK